MALVNSIKPSTYILAIIAFTFVIMAGIGLMGEFRKGDATFMTDAQSKQFNSTFNRYDDLTTSVNNIQSSVDDSGNDWGIWGTIGALTGSAWNALRLLFTSFSFMNSVFAGLTMFGIPAWVGALGSLVIIIIIAFAIYSAIFTTDV